MKIKLNTHRWKPDEASVYQDTTKKCSTSSVGREIKKDVRKPIVFLVMVKESVSLYSSIIPDQSLAGSGFISSLLDLLFQLTYQSLYQEKREKNDHFIFTRICSDWFHVKKKKKYSLSQNFTVPLNMWLNLAILEFSDPCILSTL
jgi:hypothetical protein